MVRFFVLLFCFLTTFSLADEGERKHLKIYSVGDLVGRITPFSPQTLFPTPDEVVVAEEYYLCAPHELLAMVQNVVGIEEGSFLNVSENRLFAYLSKTNHQKLEQLLKELRQVPQITVTFEVHLLELTEGTAKELLKTETASLLLDAKQKTELLAKEKVLQTLKCSTVNHHKANFFVGKKIAYIGDYDVEIAQQSSIGDPVIMEQLDGLRLVLKGTFGDPARGLFIEGQYIFTETLEWKTSDLSNANLGVIHHPVSKSRYLSVAQWIKDNQVLALVNCSEDSRLLCLIQSSVSTSVVVSEEVKQPK